VEGSSSNAGGNSSRGKGASSGGSDNLSS
jgi:hypothetical protein